MYRCSYCHRVSKPKHAMRKQVFYKLVPYVVEENGDLVSKLRKDIAKEVPICESCLSKINK